MKSTKTKLISSVTVLLICFAMLIGSTFAWFTDSASTGVNKIQAGNLDIEAYYQNTKPGGGNGTTSYTLPSNSPRGTQIYFEDAKHSLDGAVLIDDSVKFEPGYVGAKLVTVKNTGNLAAKIKLQFAVNDNDLASQIWYDFIQVSDTNSSGTFVARELTGIKDFVANREMPLSAGNEYKFIFMYGMKETAGNEYQGKSVGLSVTVLAKQMTEEYDSFDNHYDDGATYDSTIWDSSINQPATKIENGQTVYEINTAAELAWVAKVVNDGTKTFANETVKLMKDINLANIPWTPIGNNKNNEFKGTFDGDNHSISNIYCVNPNYGGLFGCIGTSTITNTTIKNLNLNNVNLTNGGNIDGECAGGALVGWIENHITGSTITIENVAVTGIKADGYKYTGGLIGYKDSEATLNIKQVSVIGTDTMNNLNSSYNENGNYKGHVGGLVGRIGSVGTLANCTISNIKISRSGTTTSDNRTGSVIGSTAGSVSANLISVRNCTVLGVTVTDNSTAIGVNASNTNIEGITVSNN